MGRWTKEFLESMRHELDPVADDCVRVLFEGPGLETMARIHGLLVDEAGDPREDLPDAVKEYLEKTRDLPPWVDEEKLRLGNGVLNSHGGLILLLHGCASLPECYVDRLGMPVLFLTQKLNRNLGRRIAETIKFVEDVHSEDGFKPTGKGLDTARKVRLMHAAVRYLILHATDEKLAKGLPPRVAKEFREHDWEEHLGLPINQEDLAYTLQTFAWVVVRGLRDLNADLSLEEEDAVIHCWNLAGYFLGVREDLLPDSVEEARELFYTIKQRVKGQTVEGISMTTAVMEFAEEHIPVPYYAAAPKLLSRYLVGDETADMLGMEKPTFGERVKGRLWLFELTFLVHFWENRLDRHPTLRKWAAKLIHAILGWEVDRWAERGGRKPFEIPDHLARNWVVNRPEDDEA
jgi:hypothetical protein